MITSEERKKRQLEWYYKNREQQIQKNKEWKKKNRDKMLKQKKEYHLKNRDQILRKKKKWRKNNQDKIKAYRQQLEVKERGMLHSRKYRLKNPDKGKEYYQKNKEKILTYSKEHSQIPHIKARRNETARIRNRKNPHSNRSGTIELQIVMNNVRRRDNNTCQWQGCKLTHKQVSIHVHHIFPRSEYPDWEEIEQFMICYCAGHHGYWHRMRGDKYSEMIPARYQENGLLGYG